MRPTRPFTPTKLVRTAPLRTRAASIEITVASQQHSGAVRYELRSPEEAPSLAIRTLLGLRLENASTDVPEQTKLDIQFAHQRVKAFAEAQLKDSEYKSERGEASEVQLARDRLASRAVC